MKYIKNLLKIFVIYIIIAIPAVYLISGFLDKKALINIGISYIASLLVFYFLRSRRSK